ACKRRRRQLLRRRGSRCVGGCPCRRRYSSRRSIATGISSPQFFHNFSAINSSATCHRHVPHLTPGKPTSLRSLPLSTEGPVGGCVCQFETLRCQFCAAVQIYNNYNLFCYCQISDSEFSSSKRCARCSRRARRSFCFLGW